jgi:hypothetical protein
MILKMRPISREILIDAPPRVVFDVVMDIDDYPEWNPFTPRVGLRTAEVEVGAEFDLDCRMTPTELLENEHEAVLALDRERMDFCMGTSPTRGRPGIRSQRWQRCRLASRGRTRFMNSEAFSGPLAPLVQLLYARKLARAFDVYCRALKVRAEAVAAR